MRCVTLGFAGANVTIPHKQRVVAACDEAEGDAVNTLVFRDGRVLGFNTDREILAGIAATRACVIGAGGAARTLEPALPADTRFYSRSTDWPPDATGCDLVVNATPVRDAVLVRADPGADGRRPRLRARGDRAGRGGAGARVRGRRRPRGARAAGRGELSPVDGCRASRRRDAPGRTLARMTLSLASAGESHGPALVAIVSGLPAGLELDRDWIDADLKRRQEGYGRSPRQQIEQDRVEVLAGLRHGRTLGTPLALVVRNVDHKNWTWGMAPWPPEGEPSGKGTKAVTLPRPGHADLAGVLKYDHDDVRNALERASARHTAVHVAAGTVAKSLLRTIGIEVNGATVAEETLQARIDEARKQRDTVGGLVEVRATGVPPGLGSYATKDDRLDARLAAAVMGIQAVKGVEIGDGFALAGLLGSEAHDEIRTDRHRDTNHAGGIEAGISNGEEIVVRAAMKPLPTLMKPLRSVDLETGEAAQALVERSDVAAVEALAVVAEAAVAWELARTARDKFGGDAIVDFVAAHRAYVERIQWPVGTPNALGRHLALVGFMGAGKSSLRRSVAERLNRDGIDLDGVIESRIGDIATFFRERGEPAFRKLEAQEIDFALAGREPAVLDLGRRRRHDARRSRGARAGVRRVRRRRRRDGLAAGARQRPAERPERAAVPRALRGAAPAVPRGRRRGRHERRP